MEQDKKTYVAPDIEVVCVEIFHPITASKEEWTGDQFGKSTDFEDIEDEGFSRTDVWSGFDDDFDKDIL